MKQAKLLLGEATERTVELTVTLSVICVYLNFSVCVVFFRVHPVYIIAVQVRNFPNSILLQGYACGCLERGMTAATNHKRVQ